MNDESNGVSAPEASEAELKSTDTGRILHLRKAADDAAKKAAQAKPDKEEPAASDDEPDDENAEPAERKQSKRLPKWAQKRLERAERLAYERAKAEFEEKQGTPAEAGKKPTREQFDYDEDQFLEALAEWKAEEKLTKWQAEQEKRANAEKAENEREKLVARIEDFDEKHGEGAWEEVTRAQIPVTDVLVQFVKENDLGFEVAKHLADNPDDAEYLATLIPSRQRAMLRELAEDLGEKPKVKAESSARKVTKAPPPVPMVSGGGKSGKNIDDPDLSTAERIAIWKAKRQSSR